MPSRRSLKLWVILSLSMLIALMLGVVTYSCLSR